MIHNKMIHNKMIHNKIVRYQTWCFQISQFGLFLTCSLVSCSPGCTVFGHEHWTWLVFNIKRFQLKNWAACEKVVCIKGQHRHGQFCLSRMSKYSEPVLWVTSRYSADVGLEAICQKELSRTAGMKFENWLTVTSNFTTHSVGWSQCVKAFCATFSRA